MFYRRVGLEIFSFVPPAFQERIKRFEKLFHHSSTMWIRVSAGRREIRILSKPLYSLRITFDLDSFQLMTYEVSRTNPTNIHIFRFLT